MCRLSPRQLRRALTRLHAAHLIRWIPGGPGRGRRSVVEMLWLSPAQRAGNGPDRGKPITPSLGGARKPKESASAALAPSAATRGKSKRDGVSFPQEKGAPQEPRSGASFGLHYPYTQRSKESSHTDAPRPQLSSRAHRWAMARLREAVVGCPAPWSRRNALLEAMGHALWQAVQREQVRTPKELASVVRRLRAALWGEELPQNRRALHAWARWAVNTALGELAREAKATRRTEEFLERLRREREEARASWADPAQRRLAEEAMATLKRTAVRKLARSLSGSAAGSGSTLADQSDFPNGCL